MALGPSRGCLQMKLGVRVSARQLHVSPLMPRAAYCAFHGRRLPHAWEWQRAGSGPTADSVYEPSLPSLYFCNILAGTLGATHRRQLTTRQCRTRMQIPPPPTVCPRDRGGLAGVGGGDWV